jgi:hypothetical protein
MALFPQTGNAKPEFAISRNHFCKVDATTESCVEKTAWFLAQVRPDSNARRERSISFDSHPLCPGAIS